MDTQEDLLLNDFFRCLQQKYSALYAEAEKNCYLICVPQKMSLTGVSLSQKFIEIHILKPSLLDNGLWHVFNDTQRSVTITGNIIRTETGYAEEGREVTILFEELFYNQQYQPFRVVCISRPLEGGSSQQPSSVTSPSSGAPPTFSFLSNFEQCTHYLKLWPENELVLKKLSQLAHEFNQSYEIVPGFEGHVVEKVRGMCKYAVEALLCANKTFRKMQNSPSQLRELSLAIETFVLGQIYDKLYSGLCTAFQCEDTALFDFIATLRTRITPQSLGVRAELASLDVTPASEVLTKLETERPICPLEKYHILRVTLNSLQQCVSHSTEAVLTSDDLLPLLVYVIIRTPLRHLHTNAFFLEHFFFAPIATTEIDYHLVTFKAAVEYLKTEQQQQQQQLISYSPSLQYARQGQYEFQIPAHSSSPHKMNNFSSSDVTSFNSEGSNTSFFRFSTSRSFSSQPSPRTFSANTPATTPAVSASSFTTPNSFTSNQSPLSPSSISAITTHRSSRNASNPISDSIKSGTSASFVERSVLSPPEVISIEKPVDLSHLKSLSDSSL